MIKVERVKDVRQVDGYPHGLDMAIGGFSSTEAERVEEEIAASVPEGVARPRTAIAHKDGYIYLMVTDYYKNQTLNGFGNKMDSLGFSRENWLFLDGGGSTQCYLYNEGNVLSRNSSRKVPMLLQVHRGKYEAWKDDGLIICKAKPEDVNFYKKLTTTKDEPGFDGFNATFFDSNHNLVGVAYDDETLHANGASWRPERACMLVYNDTHVETPDTPELSLEERLASLEERVGELEKK